MVSVPLEFNLPAEEGLVSMKIYEATTSSGPWTWIDTATEIGTYPEYIHEYETSKAQSATHWFAISTVDQQGAESELSVPMQGGTQTLVGEISERVMQRNAGLSESIVIQETEAVIEQYFSEDPYLIDPDTVSYRVKSGLTYIVLARAGLTQHLSSQGSSESWVAGLVSMKSGTSTSEASKDLFDWLMEEANRMLGIGLSRIAQMATPEIAGGLSRVIEYDISRLQIIAIE